MHLLLAIAHHISAFTVLISTIASLALLHRPFDTRVAKRLQLLDRANALAATLVLGIGLMRIFFYGKGAEYYFHSASFIAKLVLYGVASLLSLPPTLEIRRWHTALRQEALPTVSTQKLDQLRWVAMAQMGCVIGMAVCAMWAVRGPLL